MRKIAKPCLILVPCLFLSSFLNAAEPEKTTKIKLDGKETEVFFNDGDTLKILDGKYKNKRVRISGINTPESYGPVHEWQGNSPSELFEIANLATQEVRNGSWACVLQKGKDFYGRLLAICDDLAKALIEKGLAHAYSVDEDPADTNYLKYQVKAQRDKLGMWRDGVPEFIITSLHSANEREKISLSGTRATYNRKINTKTGATEKMYHEEEYATCQKVCLEQDNSCMVYIPFESRYGSDRPDCLRTGK